MLDALIAQLPGVELNDSGQIKVNGQYVESLLLNGKEFLDGNNQLMLENIDAYTVKNIEVYEGQTKLEKWRGDPDAEKHLTMDVKLKKNTISVSYSMRRVDMELKTATWDVCLPHGSPLLPS